ncbi:hypothetical protein AKJ16_DCAP21639 [Drosera capensis]
MNFRSMDEFWGFYMSQHSKPSTRRWHFAGTLMGIMLSIYGLVFNWWVILLVPLIGYGLAWYSHFFVEGNVPATFGHPIWSFLCDCKMFGLMLTGQMDKEIKRLALRVLSWLTFFAGLILVVKRLLLTVVSMFFDVSMRVMVLWKNELDYQDL